MFFHKAPENIGERFCFCLRHDLSVGRREFQTPTPLRGGEFQCGRPFHTATHRITLAWPRKPRPDLLSRATPGISPAYTSDKKLLIVRSVVRNFLRAHVTDVTLRGRAGRLGVRAEPAARGAVPPEVVGTCARLSVRAVDRSAFPDDRLRDLAIGLLGLCECRRWRTCHGECQIYRDHAHAFGQGRGESHRLPLVGPVNASAARNQANLARYSAWGSLLPGVRSFKIVLPQNRCATPDTAP